MNLEKLKKNKSKPIDIEKGKKKLSSKISRDEIDKAAKEFFANGGKIKKIILDWNEEDLPI